MTFAPQLPSTGIAVRRGTSGRSRARRGWALAGSVALALLSALFAISAGGQHVAPGSPPALGTYAMLGVFPMLAVCTLLVWRHRMPMLVAGVAVGLTLILPTTPLPALIALAAVTYAQKGLLRWTFAVVAFVATGMSFCWDLSNPTSFIALFAGNPAQGSPERIALFWVVPPLAALAVVPFASFGIGRRLLAERDIARRDSASAHRTVSALRGEVDRQRERQELARELHDTLAADLSQVALHAGALELMVGGHDQQAASAARVVRESSQHSLDDLRQMVRSLRDHDRASALARGLDDLPVLIDDALKEGMDVRAQIMLGDAASCSEQAGHACYRTVQEAISNVRRHAPGAVLYLDVRGGPVEGLSIHASNWLVPGAAPSSVGGGHGLQGMRERAELAGGTFQAGVTWEGGFALALWLPWNPP